MPITYARYVHRRPDPDAFSVNFEELGDGSILLFDPVAEATTTGIGDLYRRLDFTLRNCETVVIRGADDKLLRAIGTDALLPSNLAGKHVFSLVGGSDPANPGPSLQPVLGFSAGVQAPRLAHLREAELLAILHRSQAIFSSNDYHYDLPSGCHAEKFVRLGDALRSVFEVRRITDWLLAHVKGDTVVIADTGSLLPLVIDLREQARARYDWKIEISTLDRYPQSAVQVAEAITAARNRPMVVNAAASETEVAFLFLISVNSTGRLCQLLRTLGPPGATIIVLCETSPDPTPCDAALVSVPIVRWDVSDDGRCERCSQTPCISVHPESYELLPSTERNRVIIGKVAAEANARFWTLADEARAVQLHVNVPYADQSEQDFRHFGVWLDVVKLTGHRDFRKTCIDQLSTLDCPDLVLVPEHQTSECIAELCVEAHPDTKISFVAPGRIPDEMMPILASVRRVLVADDAVVTGRTLQNLRAELFRATQQLDIEPEVNVFVIVSRPSSAEAIKAIKRRYLGQSVRRILSGIEILLPDGRNCPWCAEFSLLSSFRQQLKGDALTAAEERIRKLEGRVEPPLFMVNPRNASTDLRTLGSVFGDLHQEAAFAAAVSAAQAVVDDLSASSGSIQLKVIDIAMAIDAYYEAVFLAALLRTVKPVHVRYQGSDPRVNLALSRIDPRRAFPGVLAELALAAIEYKIPSKQVRELLSNQENDPWMAMLVAILHQVNPT